MLTRIFIQILNMSLTGALVILAVLALRLLLKRAPHIFSYGLWAVVLFRLLCPISFESEFSLLSLLHAPTAERGAVEYISRESGMTDTALDGVSDNGMSDNGVSDNDVSDEDVTGQDMRPPHASPILSIGATGKPNRNV